MAIDGIATVLPDSQTASFKLGSSEAQATFRVYTTDPEDGPNLVSRATGVPRLGSFYIVGNDVNPLLTCTEITPNRHPDSRLTWNVLCKFETPESEDDKSGKDEDGKPTKDVEQWHPEIDISYSAVSRPVRYAYPYGALTLKDFRIDPSTAPGATIGWPGMRGDQETVVLNSANQVMDPAPEIDYSRFNLRIKKFKLEFPTQQALDFKDSVNEDPFDLKNNKLGFKMHIPRYAARIMNIGGTLKWQENLPYWEVLYEMLIDTEFGWLGMYPDMGFGEELKVGDDDGNGGTISNSDILRNGGRNIVKPFTDSEGVPLTEPQLLDGKGKRLKAGKETKYVLYSEYKQMNFLKLKL